MTARCRQRPFDLVGGNAVVHRAEFGHAAAAIRREQQRAQFGLVDLQHLVIERADGQFARLEHAAHQRAGLRIGARPGHEGRRVGIQLNIPFVEHVEQRPQLVGILRQLRHRDSLRPVGRQILDPLGKARIGQLDPVLAMQERPVLLPAQPGRHVEIGHPRDIDPAVGHPVAAHEQAVAKIAE
jgi:hypothetical protein